MTDFKDENIWRKEFAEKLNNQIAIKECSQSSLARKVGISPQAISLYSLGKATPSLHIVHKIACALNCSINDLLPEDR